MRARLFVGGLALTLAVAVAACFSPQQPACAFSCGPAGECPADYTCAGDGLCHRNSGVAHGLCLLEPQDGGSDAAETDDASDATSHD